MDYDYNHCQECRKVFEYCECDPNMGYEVMETEYPED